jgi:hypothetical protein
MHASGRRLWHSPYFWILSVFAISRVLYFAAGVRFDVTPLSGFFQIVDPLLMKTRLLETLLYLHTQPPGFNLMIGVIVKLFPASYAGALHAVYLACGLSLCFTLYRLMRILGVRPAVSAALTSLFLASPGVVLFENFLLYEYPLMALLCGSAVLFYRLLKRPDFLSATLFFSCLAALMYMRALFHLGWFILLAAFAVWLVKGRRRTVLAAAAVPFILALALYVKNAAIIGSFTSSTWLGFNADTITLHQLTDAEHETLIHSGLLSTVGRIPASEPLSAFRNLVVFPPPSGIPVLDQLNDSTGRINYNNLGYLKLHPYYVSDAEAIVLHYPRAYLRSVVRAWFAYFLPTGDFPFFLQNGPRIERFDRLFNIVVFGQWRDASNRKDLRKLEAQGGAAQLPLYTGTWLLIGLPLLFCWGVYLVWREVRGDGWRQPATALLTYLLFQIAFMTAVVNLLSCFENNRYRLPIDPFFVALLGMAAERVLSAFQSRSERTSPNSASLDASHFPAHAKTET